MTKNPLGRTDGLVIQELENEILVYDLQSNKAICLNQTSALVWRSCNGEKSVSEIARQVGMELKTEVGEDLIRLALSQLANENLLAECNNVRDTVDGVSRRKMIKKIGLTSMVTLPMIISLVVPSAVQAQSCLPDNTITLQLGCFPTGLCSNAQICIDQSDFCCSGSSRGETYPGMCPSGETPCRCRCQPV